MYPLQWFRHFHRRRDGHTQSNASLWQSESPQCDERVWTPRSVCPNHRWWTTPSRRLGRTHQQVRKAADGSLQDCRYMRMREIMYKYSFPLTSEMFCLWSTFLQSVLGLAGHWLRTSSSIKYWKHCRQKDSADWPMRVWVFKTGFNLHALFCSVKCKSCRLSKVLETIFSLAVIVVVLKCILEAFSGAKMCTWSPRSQTWLAYIHFFKHKKNPAQVYKI